MRAIFKALTATDKGLPLYESGRIQSLESLDLKELNLSKLGLLSMPIDENGRESVRSLRLLTQFQQGAAIHPLEALQYLIELYSYDCSVSWNSEDNLLRARLFLTDLVLRSTDSSQLERFADLLKVIVVDRRKESSFIQIPGRGYAIKLFELYGIEVFPDCPKDSKGRFIINNEPLRNPCEDVETFLAQRGYQLRHKRSNNEGRALGTPLSTLSLVGSSRQGGRPNSEVDPNESAQIEKKL